MQNSAKFRQNSREKADFCKISSDFPQILNLIFSEFLETRHNLTRMTLRMLHRQQSLRNFVEISLESVQIRAKNGQKMGFSIFVKW